MTPNTQTLSIGFTHRGQTTQDFVVGIGVFILAVAFVFATVPDAVDIRSAGADSGDIEQADRVAAVILDNLETDTPNEIDGTEFRESYVQDGIDDEMLGLRATDDRRFDNVNITVEPLAGNEAANGPVTVDDTALAAGDVYTDQAVVTSTRIVTVTDLDGESDVEAGDPVRLIVRMW